MTVTALHASDHIRVTEKLTPEHAEILTPEALAFLWELEHQFGARARALVEKRKDTRKAIKKGHRLDFHPETEAIREGDWQIAGIPEDLQDRRVEITGPVDRKMIINALNSGANAFMADLEDASSPTWQNMIEGQINLRDAVNGTISFTNPDGKAYKLNGPYPSKDVATLIVRPRGLHLPEKHVEVEGKAMRSALFDFGLYFFHNANTLIEKGSGPYFYLPKLENHHESAWWDEVFTFAQSYLHLPIGSIKATVLIETINAAFDMDEILYSLREHIVGQNAGRWD